MTEEKFKMDETSKIHVLVTGASSPVGEQLVQRLLEDPSIGNIVAVCDKGHPFSLPHHDQITPVEISMHSQRHLHGVLFGVAEEKKIQVVIHTAQTTSATEEGEKVHAQNVEALRNLINFAERHKTIKRLIIRSCVSVYQVQRDLPALITEDHPLNMSAGAPQWVRDRVEADCTACARMGLSALQIVVLRMAEILSIGCGSQIFDYLQMPVCLRPIGFDPMLNFLTIEDAAMALQKSIHTEFQGVFNIPGKDSLPLSEVINRWGRPSIALPETAIYWLYRLRRKVRDAEFRYGMNRRRFHYSGILDGSRAQRKFSYTPKYSIQWPIMDA